ncbi:helix-turn-helix transcriptional regulator [Sphingobacterium phlebotomi]|uniref:Helix-turn-helix transcriptional regulator n=1 Tax=Sphingobacterium phlebotomi TaxID=2605433 RepID=A0A5D4HD31_9SPHI|nr:helix-turn-helix transcriptional regulator [Sphingobacterium phlebotomi]TYR37445.1 helix-turn-helix transcriptional regulator [Sphingobacterium phlebotomi]
MLKVGDIIKEIREKQKGLRQEDVAKALGISTKAYANIENNVSDITLTRLQQLSEILGVSPEYVLNFQDKSTYTNVFNNYEGNQGTINMFQGCSSDQIKNLEHEVEKSKREASRLQAKIHTRNN